MTGVNAVMARARGSDASTCLPYRLGRVYTADVRMTKEFATTVAAVAPVILLVATVEMNRTRDEIREVSRRDAEMSHIVAGLFAGGVQPTREDYEDARRRLRELRMGKGKRLLIVLYTLSATLIGGVLAAAEIASLRWLAEGGQDAAGATAAFCYFALVGSFLWVWAVAAVRYLRAAHTSRPRREAWWFIRYWSLRWTFRRSA
ncbi:hypothetical protein [Streptomyces doebereineriae]|uniref:Uncharacterized protein n=1 Tax=Streptomyces doebereineriae TaxID=3075528 RepID=A0ABU2VBS0_9ACTN|nr:hypothetical protein [Streptomyces sp. DSM 41640]MDT0482611.1 hypothetical protein [Streptomyces sp. DSM 41640]